VQDAAAARKRARAIKPGSFLSLLVNARHADGAHLSELEAAAQAFTFLLAGARRGHALQGCSARGECHG